MTTYYISVNDLNDLNNLNINCRTNFITKVYSLLFVQLLITTLISVLFMEVEIIRNYVILHINFMYYSICFSFLFLILLFCFNKYPYNLILLEFFTFTVSYMIGTVSAIYKQNNNDDIIVYSFVITLIVFLLLTFYIHYSKKNFSCLGGFLFVCLNISIGYIILILITGYTPGILYSILGLLLFVGYILFDTSLIIHKYRDDEYVLAVISLYLDIINFFLKMLEILSYLKKK